MTKKLELDLKKGEPLYDFITEHFGPAVDAGKTADAYASFCLVAITEKNQRLQLPSAGNEPYFVYVFRNTSGHKLTVHGSANTKIVDLDSVLLSRVDDYAIFKPVGEFWELDKLHTGVAN